MTLLLIIDGILALISVAYVLYLSISYLMWKDGKELHTAKEKKRYAILIPARNEESVIEASLQAIQAMDYPEELYDTFVLINNTSDHTKELSEKNGAFVYECKGTIRSKGDVLQEFFNHSYVCDNYDAFVILDADNRIDKNFLNSCNHYLCAGYRVGQGMKTAYNPYVSWVSGASSMYFSMANAIINQPRGKKQLSGMIFGSGFYVASSFIKEMGGWKTTSITEDIDMTFMCAVNNETVAVMDDAITYDVQPISFKDAWNQRVRWLAGTMEVRKKYQHNLRKKLLHKSSLEAFDSMILLYTGDMAAIAFWLILISALLLFQMNKTLLIICIFIQWIMTMMFGIFLCKEANFSIKKMWKAIVLFWLYLLSFHLIAWISIFHKETEWKTIKH